MKSKPFISATVFYSLLFSSFLFSETESDKNKKIHKPLDVSNKSARTIDVNNMEMWVQSNGTFGENPITGGDGLYYPKGQKSLSLVYTSGLWLGALVNDTLCIMLNQFGADASPGAIGSDGKPYGQEDASFHVYKIRIEDDAATSQDYAEWPVDQGAPVDNYGNPKHMGDQTLWCCFTDGYPYRYYNQGPYDRFTGPMGAEMHMTIFGYESLKDILFIQWQIINKSGFGWHETYVAIWSDCELGSANDDLVGSDSTLSLAYDYNHGPDYKYGLETPAFGYLFLTTPLTPSISDSGFNGSEWIPGYKNLDPKSPMLYKHENTTYPGWGGGDGFYNAEQPYLRMQCRNDSGEPMINPITGIKTNWCFTGDPVMGCGWLDTFSVDRRFLLSAGPFTMASGETQKITIAIVVGQGGDPLTSVTALRYNCAHAWSTFLNSYQGPWNLPLPGTEKGDYDQQCILIWNHNTLSYSPDAWEGYHIVNYRFEGYNIYQAESPEGPWHRIATYDLKNGITVIWDNVYSEALGCVTDIPVAYGSDSGVQHFASITQDYTGKPLINGKTYYFAVSAYFYDPDGLPKVWESGKTIIEAVPQRPVLETQYSCSFGDTVFSEGGLCTVLAIDPGRMTGDTYRVEVEGIDGDLVWHLTDITTGEKKLQSWDYFGADNSFPVVDGFMVQVTEEAANGDAFTFTTNAPQKSAAIAKSRLDEINVFPNPYFGQNSAESDFYTQFVTFNNLPEECTVRIFSLSGVLIKTIRHDNGTPFERWYLMNESRLAISSGMYIIHVQTEFGDRILKFAFINREARYLHL